MSEGTAKKKGSWNTDDAGRPKWKEGVTIPKGEYEYQRADGSYSFTIRKGWNEAEGEKVFELRRPNTIPLSDRHTPEDHKDFFYELGDQKAVLFRLPKLIAEAKAKKEWRVFIVEGEKDVETAERLGLLATTNPFGAEKWFDEFSPNFRGAHVVEIIDADLRGRKHSSKVCTSLKSHGHCASITAFEIPGFKDLTEWFEDQEKKGLSGPTMIHNLEVMIKDHFGNEKGPVDPLNRSDDVMSLADFIELKLPPPDYISGSWLTTTSRTLLYAPTGIGKTMFCTGLAIAMAAGKPFLHWKATRKVKVLYIDGEMSRGLFQERVIDECKRLGVEPTTVSMWILSHENIINDMLPLNTPAGQAFVEEKIKKIGGVDIIFFDNIMHLLLGDPKDTEPWRAVMPWVKNLTTRNIGAFWVHHTGHDESHSYGPRHGLQALAGAIVPPA